jgi:hypothetical protein
MNKQEIKVAIECMREDGYSDKEIEAELGVTVVKKPRKRRSDAGRPKGLSEEHKQKMQDGKAAKKQTARHAKMQEILADVGTCRCDFSVGMTDEEIYAKAKNSCTMPSYLCPTADRMLRYVYEG